MSPRSIPPSALGAPSLRHRGFHGRAGLAGLALVSLLAASLPTLSRATHARGSAASLTGRASSFARSVRGEFDAPTTGAPAIGSLTTSEIVIARIKPLEDALASLDPASPPAVQAIAHCDLANALSAKQFDDAAAAEYLAALGLDASLAPAWNNIASLLRRTGKRSLAHDALRTVLQLEPRNGLAWFTLALLQEDEGKFDASDESYLKALSYQPSLWLPSRNPLVIGNRRAQMTLLRNYMAHGGAAGGATLDPSPIVVP